MKIFYFGILLFLAATLAAACNEPKPKSRPAAAPPARQVSQEDSGKTYEGLDLILRVHFKPLPETMPGSENDTPALIDLGHRLFHDPDLSRNRSQSCNSCHLLDHGRAGVDYRPTSQGDNGTLGTRNSPTVINAGFQIAQFWDGRAPDLVEQAKGPMVNPIEMGMDEGLVVERLKAREDCRRAFAAAFPGDPDPITYENTALAIAAFERTLITPARFDRFLKGDRSALSDQERQGLQEFIDVGCIDCHSSTPLGGRQYRKLGEYQNYPNQDDKGRFVVTKKGEDMMVFRVASLRNVTLTPPYFHDGRGKTLEEATREMARLQLNAEITPEQLRGILAFMKSLESEVPLRFDRLAD